MRSQIGCAVGGCCVGTRGVDTLLLGVGCRTTAWLSKQGQHRKGWKKRFFARAGNLLFYYSTETEVKSVIGVIFLEGSTTKSTMSRGKQTCCFQVQCTLAHAVPALCAWKMYPSLTLCWWYRSMWLVPVSLI